MRRLSNGVSRVRLLAHRSRMTASSRVVHPADSETALISPCSRVVHPFSSGLRALLKIGACSTCEFGQRCSSCSVSGNFTLAARVHNSGTGVRGAAASAMRGASGADPARIWRFPRAAPTSIQRVFDAVPARIQRVI